MTMPNFLIIGAMKAGTTALYATLAQHPQIYMSPNKEPHFFTHEGGKPSISPTVVNNLADYQALFADVTDEIAIGEATPNYLVQPEVAATIHRYLPDAKLIAILRDPAERAYSHYLHRVLSRREDHADFLEAFRYNETLAAEGYYLDSYRLGGMYYENLCRYYDRFPAAQIKVVLYDDWRDDPAGTAQALFDFLGVDTAFVPDARWYYKTGKPKSALLNDVLRYVRTSNVARPLRKLIPANLRRNVVIGLHNRNVARETLTPEDRAMLIDLMRDDILKLQDLLGRDLSVWLRI
ncbi:MAG: sulfotransferase [Chloroflexi bacterium]|nr:sulfotransferase [Chloroflexota bacterium]